MTEIHYLTFQVGSQQFCIPAEMVVDINRNCDCTYVPGAPESIKGILNLRGQLIVAFDMATTLGINAELNTPNPVSIIVDVDSSRISLLVDQVGDILSLNESTFETPPSNFPAHIRQAVLGAHKLNTTLLIVLDPCLFIKGLIGNSNPGNTSASDLLILSQ